LESAEYKRYVENSRRLINFPMPRNYSGSDNFEASVEILEEADSNLPSADDRNKRYVWQAIDLLNEPEVSADLEERVRKQTLISILWFGLNEPRKSAIHAEEALRLAIKAEVRGTMPSLLVALGELSKDEPDYDRSLSLFERAIARENDSRFQPLAYMIYADRLMASVAGTELAAEMLNALYRIQGDVSYRQERALMHVSLVEHHAWELERQKSRVAALTDTDIVNTVDPSSLVHRLEAAVEQHRRISREYEDIVAIRLARIRKETREESFLEKGFELFTRNDWEAQWAVQLKSHEDQLAQVRRDQRRLVLRIEQFKQQLAASAQSEPLVVPLDSPHAEQIAGEIDPEEVAEL
jgi:tetratricopeptide (TPR) repeat protein